MILKNKNLWDDLAEIDVICIPANGVVKMNGELVMGAGFAKQAAKRWPKLPKIAGRKLQNYLEQEPGMRTYLILPFKHRSQYFCFLQTKFHWMENSDLDLIRSSTDHLASFSSSGIESDLIFALPFPGIGKGGLPRKQVLPIIENLTDNVWVYELPESKS